MDQRRRTARRAAVLVAAAATAIGVLAGWASGDSGSPAAASRGSDLAALGRDATWTTIFEAAGGIEGLTADNRGSVAVAPPRARCGESRRRRGR